MPILSYLPSLPLHSGCLALFFALSQHASATWYASEKGKWLLKNAIPPQAEKSPFLLIFSRKNFTAGIASFALHTKVISSPATIISLYNLCFFVSFIRGVKNSMYSFISSTVWRKFPEIFKDNFRIFVIASSYPLMSFIVFRIVFPILFPSIWNTAKVLLSPFSVIMLSKSFSSSILGNAALFRLASVE